MTLVAVGLCGATVTIALKSSYLGKDNIELFASGSKIVLGWFRNLPFLPTLLGILPETVGWFWLTALLGLVLLVLLRIRCLVASPQVGIVVRLIVCTLILGCAICWWWFIASPQPRYLFPFLLIPIAWLSQDIFRFLKRRSTSVQKTAAAYFFAPSLGVIVLLWMPTPPATVQKLLGVNLTAGTFAQEVNLGHKLLAECADQQKPLTLYSLAGVRAGVAISVQQYIRTILDEPGYSFSGIGPVDWRRPPGVRLDELVASDLVICDRSVPTQTKDSVSPKTYHEEVAAVGQFLDTMTNGDGLNLIFDGDLRAYKIVDRDRLGAALVKWAKKVSWHTAFPEHNESFLEETSEVRSPNTPPFGNIEEPLTDVTATGPQNVTGWAVDDRGILEVRVFVDGKLATVTRLTRERPDVSKAHPRFHRGNDRHGWQAIVELGAPGPHKISVQALDTEGAITELGVRTVMVSRL